MTCQFIYKDDEAGWTKAKDLLSKLIGSDRAKCITALQKRATFLQQNAIDDATLKQHLLDGPRNTHRANTNRQRSRSPATSRSGTSQTSRRRSPATTNTSDQRPPSGRGRGRGGQRSRSSSRSRVLQFSRENNNSRARSPRASNDVRSSNSLWNEQSSTSRPRKALQLSKEEQAIISALRNTKS